MTDATQAAKNTCELHGADLSAVLDGELETVALLRTLDHLVSCPGCAEFYRRSRDLDLAVAAWHSGEARDGAIEPSDAVWQRIAKQAPWTEAVQPEEAFQPEKITGAPVASLASRRRSRRRIKEWAPRLAAAFAVAFGLWIVYAATRDAGTTEFFRQASEASVEASADVLSDDELSENGIDEIDATDPLASGAEMAEMDEERFVRLATEVLRADPRFQHEMLRVMKTATRADSREAATDLRRVEEDRERPELSAETGRWAGERAWK